MPIARTILAEFNHEMANTRKVLERIPEEQAGWKPHPKSYSLGDLAMHIMNLPTWVGVTLKQEELDFDPPGGKKEAKPAFDTRKALLQRFDSNVAEAVSVIADASDEVMRSSWTLKNRGTVVFSLPRVQPERFIELGVRGNPGEVPPAIAVLKQGVSALGFPWNDAPRP